MCLSLNNCNVMYYSYLAKPHCIIMGWLVAFIIIFFYHDNHVSAVKLYDGVGKQFSSFGTHLHAIFPYMQFSYETYILFSVHFLLTVSLFLVFFLSHFFFRLFLHYNELQFLLQIRLCLKEKKKEN